VKCRPRADVCTRPADQTGAMFTSLLPLVVPGYIGPGPMMGHHAYGFSSFFGGILMFLGPLLLVLFLIFLYKRAERRGTPLFGWGPEGRPEGGPGAYPHHHHGPHTPPAPEDEALRTLANRLAAGDISPEDYRERVDTLRTTRAQATDPTAGMPYMRPEDKGSEQGGQPS